MDLSRKKHVALKLSTKIVLWCKKKVFACALCQRWFYADCEHSVDYIFAGGCSLRGIFLVIAIAFASDELVWEVNWKSTWTCHVLIKVSIAKWTWVCS